MTIQLRRYRGPDEVVELAELYAAAAMRLGSTAYSEAQVRAWASWADDVAGVTRRLESGVVLVAEIDGATAGFGRLEPPGLIDLLFTHPDYARRGVASAIYRALETAARDVGAKFLTTHASHLSRPLFEREGFRIDEQELSEFKGQHFERFRMSKRL